MKLTVKTFNRFLIFQLPSAFFSGVRVESINAQKCVVKVKLNWFNKNPFKSIYFAVLAMAAELSTGALVLKQVKELDQNISTLVLGMSAEFHKKAKGRVKFVCEEGELVQEKIAKCIQTQEGEVFKLIANGFDKEGDKIASFIFEWTVKLKR